MPWKPPTHRPLGARSDQQRKADYDAQRGTASQRGYNSKWRRLRATVLRDQPLCVRCLPLGFVKAATDVDHIVPHKGNMTLFWDRNNLQPLCKSCHSHKTATEDSRFAQKKEN